MRCENSPARISSILKKPCRTNGRAITRITAPATDAIASAVRGTPIAKMLRCRHITVPAPLTCAPKQAVALVKRARREAITTSAQTMVTMPRLTFLPGGHAKLRFTVLATGATAHAARGIPIATTPRRLSMDAEATPIPTCASTRTAARVKRAHRMTLDLELELELELEQPDLELEQPDLGPLQLLFLLNGPVVIRTTRLPTDVTAHAARGIPIATTPRRLSIIAAATSTPTCASTRTAARVKRARRLDLDLDRRLNIRLLPPPPPRRLFLPGGRAILLSTMPAMAATARAARGIPIATAPTVVLSIIAATATTRASTRTAARVKHPSAAAFKHSKTTIMKIFSAIISIPVRTSTRKTVSLSSRTSQHP